MRLRPSRRVAGLDLLRGVAVGLVMLHHAFPTVLPGAGLVGVVVFFTLSGHLITGVLLDELDATGGLDVGRFYARRARRLVPALLAMVAGLAAVTLLLDPVGDRRNLPATVAVALTWTGDLPFAHPSAATYHLWTLALEEQFYLLWPALLLVGHRRGRLGLVLAASGVACALACVATVVWLSSAPDAAYSLPTSWAGCFVVGAVSCVWVDRWHSSRAAAWALAALLLLGMVPLRGHALTYLAGGPAIAVLTAVVLLAWRRVPVVTGRLPGLLVRLGTVSYAAYLWNYPLTIWLRPHTPLAGPLALVLTVAAAALSWRYVESRRRAPEPARERVAA